MAMTSEALAENFALQNHQSGEQRRGPRADLIMSEGAATALLKWQARLRAIQSLHLALLIPAKNQALFWRIKVKAHHVGQLLQKFDIARELECTRSMRLEIVLLPQTAEGARTDLLNSRHRPATPVRRTFGLGLQSGFDDGAHLLLTIRWLAATTGMNLP